MSLFKDNWEFLALAIGGVGTLWNFIGDKWKNKLSRPFVKKKQRIEIDSDKIQLDVDKLEFVEKLQDFQNEQLTDLLNKYQVLKKETNHQILELEVDLEKRKSLIAQCKLQMEEDKIFLKKHRNHIKYLEHLLEENNINHNKLIE